MQSHTPLSYCSICCLKPKLVHSLALYWSDVWKFACCGRLCVIS